MKMKFTKNSKLHVTYAAKLFQVGYDIDMVIYSNQLAAFKKRLDEPHVNFHQLPEGEVYEEIDISKHGSINYLYLLETINDFKFFTSRIDYACKKLKQLANKAKTKKDHLHLSIFVDSILFDIYSAKERLIIHATQLIRRIEKNKKNQKSKIDTLASNINNDFNYLVNVRHSNTHIKSVTADMILNPKQLTPSEYLPHEIVRETNIDKLKGSIERRETSDRNISIDQLVMIAYHHNEIFHICASNVFADFMQTLTQQEPILMSNATPI